MNPEAGSTQPTPIVADGAPRLSLALNIRSHEETKVACRRVVTLIGSREGCKVSLRHELVSPVHLAVVNDGAQVFAVDLASKRGARLNGLKLEHERLSDGDVLTVYPWELRVEVEEPTQTGSADVLPFSLDPSPRHVVLEHVDSGRILKPTRELCVIGRRNGCDIVVSDRQVSRVHALLLNYFGRPAVFDLLSRNQTFVNDEAVSFSFLDDSDMFTVGETCFRVRLVGSAVAERAGKDQIVDEAGEATVALDPVEHTADMIDIQAVETTENWRIADSLEKVAQRR